MIRVLGLSLYGPQAASHRVRLSQFQPGLAAAGIELQIQSLLDDAYLQRSFKGERPSLRALLSAYVCRIHALRHANRFDLVIAYGDLLPYLPSFIERKLLKVPFIYDCDDAFFLKYRNRRLRLFQPFLADKIDRLMAAAEGVTAGNAWLANYARGFNTNVSVLPSVVDTDQFRPCTYPQSKFSGSSFTVGWIGSPSTAPYLRLLIEPLKLLARERPVCLIVVGGPAPEIAGVEVIERPWSLEHEVSVIQGFDVGVMPLPNNLWTRGKCAYKLIQCMACAVPVIASKVGANLEVVPTECGLLVDSSHEWVEAFRKLASDKLLRQRMGTAARQWVEQHYSLRISLPILADVIEKSVSSRRGSNL